jgi:hypothetical protein
MTSKASNSFRQRCVHSLSAADVRCASLGGASKINSAVNINIESSRLPTTRDLAAPSSFLNRVYDFMTLSPAFVIGPPTSYRASIVHLLPDRDQPMDHFMQLSKASGANEF